MSSKRLLLGFHTYGYSFMHVPALFARTGLPVDAVLTDRHTLRRVRSIDQTYLASHSEWARTIEQRLLTGEYSHFFNADEPGLKALYNHSWHPDAIKYLPVHPTSEAASTIGCKHAFHNWCLKADLPVPETHICFSFQEAVALQKQLPGNWFIKGATGSGGQTVFRPATVRRASDADSKAGTWLLQSDAGPQVGTAMFLAAEGKLLAWMAFNSVVALDDGLGPTVMGRGDSAADIGELCQRFAAASQVSAMTGFDFVRHPKHGPLLIDSHLGRMCSTQHFDQLYGVDFAAALRGYLVEGKQVQAGEPIPGRPFIKFPELLQLAMQGGFGRLVPHFDRSVHVPLAPSGDPLIAVHDTMNILISETRVGIGRMRRKLSSPR